MPLLKGLSRSPLMVRIGSALAEAYLRLVFRTSRVTRDPSDTDAKLLSQHPQIFAMWHGQALTMPMIKPAEHAEIAVIVSRHGDAEIMARTLQRFGMRVVRGAGDAGRRPNNRGGSAALRSALRVLKEGATFAMTADVPPGPARRAGEGIVLLAKLSGRPIVPCAMVTKRYFALNSWSTYTINLPFSRLAIVVGEPIWVPPAANSEELEKSRISVEQGLSEVTARAYAMAGSPDPHLARCARGAAPRLRKR